MLKTKEGKIRRSSTNRRTPKFSSVRQGRIVAIVLMVALMVALMGAGAALVARGRAGGAAAKYAAPMLSPSPLPAGSPSKEYIYVGGRLVATEEPTH